MDYSTCGIINLALFFSFGGTLRRDLCAWFFPGMGTTLNRLAYIGTAYIRLMDGH